MSETHPTIEELTAKMQRNGEWLDLRGTGITQLPDGLTVGGSIDLSGTGITQLPDGLTVGGSLYLSAGNVVYHVTVTTDRIKVGCADHPVAFWRDLDGKGAARLDGRSAVKWWRAWGPELLRWRDARAALAAATTPA